MKYFLIIFIAILFINKENKMPPIIDKINSEFSAEKKVIIKWYSGDVMEPYISKDDKYLFFNSNKWKTSKDLFYAKKINDITFQYMGEIWWINTLDVDWNPTMDSNNNFYFISTRSLSSWDFNTLYSWKFNNWFIKNLKKVEWTINLKKRMWINMWIEISGDWNTMYTSNARFKIGNNFPSEWDIRFAIKEWNEFNIPKNEKSILKNINTTYAIEYAGELSNNQLEIFYSQVTLSKPPKFKLYVSKRNSIDEAFWIPKIIDEPFLDDEFAFVEWPTLSMDWKKLYYHKLKNWKFSIYMISRK